tara:strand:- start:562 stop:888 length:327 start_codon:yes stop_codon:yes gene_type:complete
MLHSLISKILAKPVLNNFIIISYLFNFLITISIFAGLLYTTINHISFLGWIFMSTLGLKFIAFFVFIYPLLNLDGSIEKFEFFSFFIPYIICMIIEIKELLKILKSNS